jgi:hypothetical protein
MAEPFQYRHAAAQLSAINDIFRFRGAPGAKHMWRAYDGGRRRRWFWWQWSGGYWPGAPPCQWDRPLHESRLTGILSDRHRVGEFRYGLPSDYNAITSAPAIVRAMSATYL